MCIRDRSSLHHCPCYADFRSVPSNSPNIHFNIHKYTIPIHYFMKIPLNPFLNLSFFLLEEFPIPLQVSIYSPSKLFTHLFFLYIFNFVFLFSSLYISVSYTHLTLPTSDL